VFLKGSTGRATPISGLVCRQVSLSSLFRTRSPMSQGRALTRVWGWSVGVGDCLAKATENGDPRARGQVVSGPCRAQRPAKITKLPVYSVSRLNKGAVVRGDALADRPEVSIANLPSFKRRRLLLFMSALLAGGILPLPLVAESASSERKSSGLSLEDFMRLSTALSGHAGLDKELGQIYLDALLHTPQGEDGLTRLLAELEEGEMPAYVREELQPIARGLLLAWYTGHYPTMDGPKVATFTQALAWHALGYTTAPSLCGGTMGHWGNKPNEP
jgi:hypothetical protein